MKFFTTIILLASIAGLIDTFYLVEGHYSGSIACPTNQEKFLGLRIDCGAVDESKYSEILGIPLALFGFFYYLSIFLIIYFPTPIKIKIQKFELSWLDENPIQKIIAIITSIGFLVTLYLLHLQFNVLEVICKYCMYSALSTIILFGTSWIYVFHPIDVID